MRAEQPARVHLPFSAIDGNVHFLEERSPRPFLTPGGSTQMETVADTWRRKLNKVWELCGEWEEPPTSHRFRHTFVRVLLERGGAA